MVSREEWRKAKDLKLYAKFDAEEGATEGGGTFLGIGKAGRRDYSYHWPVAKQSTLLPRPPHIAVEQTKFNYRATSAKGDTQVIVLQSEEDWSASTSASWIHLTTSENNTATKDGIDTVSGKATGSGKKQVMLSVDPVTDGKPRGGKVVFKASDGETCVVEILQAGQ